MNLQLKTAKAKRWLSLGDDDLVATLNGTINNESLSVDLRSDAKKIMQYLLGINKAVIKDQGKDGKEPTISLVGAVKLATKPVHVKTKDTSAPMLNLEETAAHCSLVDDTDSMLAFRYLQLKRSASARGLEFKLSINKLAKILSSKKCHYSGVAFGSGLNSVTVDRINSDIGYVDSNVVPCTLLVNQLKEALIESSDIQKSMRKAQVANMLKAFIKTLPKD